MKTIPRPSTLSLHHPRSWTWPLLGITLVCVFTLGRPPAPLQAAPLSSTTARAVWGQSNVSSTSTRCTPTSSLTLCGPTTVVSDATGDVWVADILDNRVLLFPPGSAIAGKVFGQYGSMTTRGCDQPPPHSSASPPAPNRYTLCQPAGLAIDPQGTLYIADALNNRILVYFHAAQKPTDSPADRVLGQQDFHASASNDRPAGGASPSRCPAPHPASACSLFGPTGISLTPQGDLLVPDLDNHRVLLWSAASLAHLQSPACRPTCFLPAGHVWGQYGSFRTMTSNNPVIPAGSSSRCTAITIGTPASACTLSGPWSALADATGDLIVADTANNRVLAYEGAIRTGRQDATSVSGQAGSFVDTAGNGGGVSASSLWNPLGLALDAAGTLWVADFLNMRVLHFGVPGTPGATTADQVLGQPGGVTGNGCRRGTAGLCGPTGVSIDAAGQVLVADAFNSRVLAFSSSPLTLAHIDHLTVTRAGAQALIRWHASGPIRGFDLYAGQHRLTGHLLVSDRWGDCHFQMPWEHSRAVSVHVVLQTGQEVSVSAW